MRPFSWFAAAAAKGGAPMSMTKVAAAITVTSGLLAAGATGVIQRRVAHAPAQQEAATPAVRPTGDVPTAPVGGGGVHDGSKDEPAAMPAVTQGEMAEVRERLKEDLPTAHVSRPPEEPRVPTPSPPSMVLMAEAWKDVPREPAASVAANPPVVVPLPEPEPEEAALPEGGTWQSTPRPELRGKADAMLGKGDVASARLWLRAAADEGDAEAMFRLAETYDPNRLGAWGVVGMASDTAHARRLYEKALGGGVEAARAPLERLKR